MLCRSSLHESEKQRGERSGFRKRDGKEPTRGLFERRLCYVGIPAYSTFEQGAKAIVNVSWFNRFHERQALDQRYISLIAAFQ